MSLQRLNNRNVTEAEYASKKQMIIQFLLEKVTPIKVYLIGSYVDRVVHSESDIDVLLVFKSECEIRSAQKALFSIKPVDCGAVVEYVFVAQDRFNEMKNIGGICFEANNYGDLIYG